MAVNKRHNLLGPAILVSLLFVAPLVMPIYWVMVLSEILILGLMAISFNLLFGYTGLLSFGQGAFFGLGAYTAALMLQNGYNNLFLILLAGMFVAFLASIVVGFLSVRLDEIYFAMITLGFGMMFFSIAHNWIDVTGGSDGLPVFSLPSLNLFGTELTFYAPTNMYYLVLVFVILGTFLLWLIVNSPFGLILKALRENKQRVSFVGGNVNQLRIVAFSELMYFHMSLMVSPSVAEIFINEIATAAPSNSNTM
ncbi:MAG: branched-chain amino acid ABC transporter permease, partial [Deltaproteobacteria bacterium]|nr:branched-chain amino acid ABC transporter permease [Deltaproteobacteria bacterium]